MKTALITGASKGIGREVARILAQNNWRVILVARNEEKLKSFIEQFGDHHQYITADLTDNKSIDDLISKVMNKYDQLDLLINSAGEGIYEGFENISVDVWQKSYQLNVFSIFYLTQGLMPLLKKTNNSLVMNLGSICGVRAVESRTLYCSTKFALRGLSLSLSKEYVGQNPAFTLITLGSTLTSFGSMTLEEKKKNQENGKKYLKLEEVGQRLFDIVNKKSRQEEYTILP